MKFNQLNGFVVDKASGVIGAVASVDFIKQTISIMTDEDEVITTGLADAEFLEQIGAIGEVGVINHDVVATTDGKLYEIVLVDANSVQLHLLNAKLERVEAGDVIAKTDLHALAPYVEVIGNIYELEPEETVDFNIKVVRTTSENVLKFFYACNNADVNQVDLIKVVFVGHHLLEEENYERITLSHEEYLEAVAKGVIVETDPQALLNYVTGMAYGKKEEPQVAVAKEQVEEDDDFEDLELEICDECGCELDECECEEW